MEGYKYPLTLDVDEARQTEANYRHRCRMEVTKLIGELTECLERDVDEKSFRLSGNPEILLRQAFEFHYKAECLRNVAEVLTHRQNSASLSRV